MTQSQALNEVKRQLAVWKKAGRVEDIKIIAKYQKLVLKQVLNGHINLQRIVNAHHYYYKDGKYYGKKKPQQPAKAKRQSPGPKANNQRSILQKHAQIPVAHKPVLAVTRLEKSWQGFPAVLVHTAKMELYFRNGNTVGCSNWSPTILAPTPGSVGKKIKGCKIYRGQPKGKRLRHFAKGAKVDITFGNMGAVGSNWIDSAATRIAGSNLRMTKDGRIAIGKYRTSTLSSGGNSVYARNNIQAIKG